MRFLRKTISFIVTLTMIMSVISMTGISVVNAAKKVKVTSVSVSEKELTLYVGETATIEASVLPEEATDKRLSYTSSKKTIAAVSSKGVITAKKAGKATITVKAKDGSKKQATIKVTVKDIKVTAITVTETEMTLIVGESVKVMPTIEPENASVKAVTYTTSKKAVATVTSKGKITAKKAGQATITLTAKDGSKQKATIKVTVVKKKAESSKEEASSQEETSSEEEGPSSSKEEKTEEVVSYPEQSFEEKTNEKDAVTVKVKAPAGAFPLGTTMEVKAVADQDVEKQIKKAVEGDITFVKAVDITFKNAEGKDIEPKAAISVEITSNVITDKDLQLVHIDDDKKAEVVNDVNVDLKKEKMSFKAGDFSVYVIVGTETITTPSGELSFKGEGYTVKVSYTEESNIPVGTVLSVRELKEGTDEYKDYLEQTEDALFGDKSESKSKKENTFEKLSRMLNGFEKLEQTNIFDISLIYEDKEIEPDPNHPLTVEITYDTDVSLSKKDDEVEAKIVHFAQEGTEVITDVKLQDNKDGSVTLAYEQNSFSRTAATLVQACNTGWVGGNGNVLTFRYGYTEIDGKPIFEIQYNGPSSVGTPGTWPGDIGYPISAANGQCNPGTTMMELIEACNNYANHSIIDSIKVIMATTYTVNRESGAHAYATLGGMYRDLRTTIGDSFVLYSGSGQATSEEYWYSQHKWFRIERGLDANGNGWHAPLVNNQGSLPLDILSGVIIDNKSANSDIRESNGKDDSKTGEIYPIAVTCDGGGSTGTASASGLTMFFNGCHITDSSYNGTPVGTGAKIINNGSLEMFSHGNTATNAASSYIENMAVAVDQIKGKTRLKTAHDPFGVNNHNTIGVALSYGQSIGKWYLHLSQNMSRVPIWLRRVTQWRSGDIVMDSGWQVQGRLRSPVENVAPNKDIDKLDLVNESDTSSVMGLEFYVGTNQDPYPVIRFWAGSVFNTRTKHWYRTLYDAVTPGQHDVTGTHTTDIQDNDTLVFYADTEESHQIQINNNITIRGAFDTEDLNGTETERAKADHYTCHLLGASTNWIQVNQGKTVTFGGNATTDQNGTVGTVSSGNPGTLNIDASSVASFDIVNYGTTNLKSNVTLKNAAVAGVYQEGEEHLYEGAKFSGNAVDHWLRSDGTVATTHYITLETTNPNGGQVVTNKLGIAAQQFDGRDVVVEGTEIQGQLSGAYLAKFTLTDMDNIYAYKYTSDGGPSSKPVLELKLKHFYVYHSSDHTIDRIGFDQLTNGKFDLSGIVKSNHRYGGYYNAYGGTSKTDDQIKALTYTNGVANDTNGVVYTGASLKNGSTRFWTKANAYTAVKGTELVPADETVYYLKEVPAIYLTPKGEYVGSMRSLKLDELYFISVVDDLNYSETGTYIKTSSYKATLCGSIMFKRNRDADYSVSITPNGLIERRGYISYYKDAGTLISSLNNQNVKQQPYWKTLDNVEIKGDERTLRWNKDDYTAITVVGN